MRWSSKAVDEKSNDQADGSFILKKKNAFSGQERNRKMASKVQIKPIKNNPLFAKLKAKKKELNLSNKSKKSNTVNKEQK